jgi:hypothetical protein
MHAGLSRDGVAQKIFDFAAQLHGGVFHFLGGGEHRLRGAPRLHHA